tara:strand:- start:844 stop:1245 length:402 start_codon:yes stop_codon:yes gene_type:complete
MTGYTFEFRQAAIWFAKREKAMFPYLPTKSVVERAIFFAHESMEDSRKEYEDEEDSFRRKEYEDKDDSYRTRMWLKVLGVACSEKPRPIIPARGNRIARLNDEEGDDNRLTQFGVSCHTLPSSNPMQLNFIND